MVCYMLKLIRKILMITLLTSPLMLISGELEYQVAKELLDLTKPEEMGNVSIERQIEAMKKLFSKNEKTTKLLVKFFDEDFDPEIFRDEIIQIYSEAFSESEMKEMIVFYKSKTGQKLLEKMPEITKRSKEVTNKHFRQNIDDIQRMLAEESIN